MSLHGNLTRINSELFWESATYRFPPFTRLRCFVISARRCENLETVRSSVQSLCSNVFSRSRDATTPTGASLEKLLLLH